MKHNYTFDVIKFTHKYPLLSNIFKQVLFWIVAYSLFLFIVHQNTVLNLSALGSGLHSSALPLILFAVSAGIFFGVALGCIDHFLRKRFYRNQPLGLNILAGSSMYFLVLMMMTLAGREAAVHYAEDLFVNSAFIENILEQGWRHYFFMLMVYTLFMTLVMSFLNQMNKKFGPGYFLPILLGRFRYPREEERVFMFLDLASSTNLAEKLGHLKYSSLIQECFLDINKVVKKYNAEIYQYVGDEVVISWPTEAMLDYSCTEFFFSVQKHLKNKEKQYIGKYGILPKFKAGVHVGTVTMVEVGDVKRDIAYHGDTLNVASRLEGLCNELGQHILVSGTFKEKAGLEKKYRVISLGLRKLEGRDSSVEIFSLTEKNEKNKNNNAKD